VPALLCNCMVFVMALIFIVMVMMIFAVDTVFAIGSGLRSHLYDTLHPQSITTIVE
jgi:hypothetical protein